MKQILKKISLVLLSIFVVFLSIGVSVSKMQCSVDGRLFLGTQVPNCMQEKEMVCGTVLDELSCCKKEEVQQSCCPQTKDNSCASETENIQFDFQILTHSFEFNFKEVSVLLYSFFLCDKLYNLKLNFNYFNDISFLKFSKPELPEIQSFLL